MGEPERDAGAAKATPAVRDAPRELSAAALRAAAQKLSQILTASDDAALERLRKRRLGRDDIDLSDLHALKALLVELAGLLEGGEAERWERLAAAREVLALPEEADDDPSLADLEAPEPGGPAEPERLDRPAAGPPPIPAAPEPEEATQSPPLASPEAPPSPPLEAPPVGPLRDAPRLDMPAEEAVRLARRVSREVVEPPVLMRAEPSSRSAPMRPRAPTVEGPAFGPYVAAVPFTTPEPAPEVAAPSGASGTLPPPPHLQQVLEAPRSELVHELSPDALQPENRRERAASVVAPSPGDTQDAPVAATAAPRPRVRDDETIAVMGLPPRAPLPFVSPRRDPAGESDAATRLFGYASLAHPLALSVEEYAGLCAERDLRPAVRRQTEERYGIHDGPTRDAVDRFFQLLLSADAEAYATWESRYELFSRALGR